MILHEVKKNRSQEVGRQDGQKMADTPKPPAEKPNLASKYLNIFSAKIKLNKWINKKTKRKKYGVKPKLKLWHDKAKKELRYKKINK